MSSQNIVHIHVTLCLLLNINESFIILYYTSLEDILNKYISI